MTDNNNDNTSTNLPLVFCHNAMPHRRFMKKSIIICRPKSSPCFRYENVSLNISAFLFFFCHPFPFAFFSCYPYHITLPYLTPLGITHVSFWTFSLRSFSSEIFLTVPLTAVLDNYS